MYPNKCISNSMAKNDSHASRLSKDVDARASN